MNVASVLLGAVAAPARQVGQAASAGPGIGGALLGLLLVLALIFGLAWLLKRLPGARLGLHPGERLRVVAALAVGHKDRVMVVQVGAEQLLLGSGPAGVTLLHRLPEPLPEAPPAPAADFPRLLAGMLRKERR